MTTIAYKDGIIAYDSRVTSDNIILDDNFEKKIVRGEVTFFLCGATSDADEFIDSYLSGKYNNKHRYLDTSAIIWDGYCLYRCAISDNWMWRSLLRLDGIHAAGSGSNFAMAFMDTGMSAKESVIATMKRDAATGGEVRIFKLLNNE